MSEAIDDVDEGDILEVDIEQGAHKNITKNKRYKARGFLLHVIEIIKRRSYELCWKGGEH